jgi:hypothetical protein
MCRVALCPCICLSLYVCPFMWCCMCMRDIGLVVFGCSCCKCVCVCVGVHVQTCILKSRCALAFLYIGISKAREYTRDCSVDLFKSVHVLLYVLNRYIQKSKVPKSIYFLMLSVGWVPHFLLLLQVCQRGQIQIKEPTVRV